MRSTMYRVIPLLLLLPLVHAVCPKGSFIDKSNGDECTLCPTSTYNNRVDATSCIKCPGGGYTDSSGSTSRSDCKDCPPGMDLNEDDECFTCDPGTHNPFVNSRVCFKCPKGTFSNTYNPTYCRACHPGRVTNKRNTAECKLCKGKKYQPQLGQKFCIPCPPGSVTNPSGASCKPTCNPKNKNCKICPKGKELDDKGKCVKCPEGTINAFPSNTKCQPCPQALKTPFIVHTVLVPNKARTKCVCRAGEFLDLTEPFGPNELNPVCGTCPKGKGSNGIKCDK